MKALVGIWGLGESGVGAALLAHRLGYPVRLVAATEPQPKYAEKLRAAGLSWRVTDTPEDLLGKCDLVVRSPGIRPDTPALQALLARGIPVISDLEWGWRHFPAGAQLWLVTGSTGKTSTTTLLAHMLRTAGRSAIACGNVGYSFCAALAEGRAYDYYVVEASSFQLWDTHTLVPHLLVLTSLSFNHLDWHGSFAAYREAKLHILRRLPPTAHVIYNKGSSLLEKAISEFQLNCNLWPYRLEGGEGIYAWTENHKLICDMKQKSHSDRWEVSYEGTPFESPGQRSNSLAAAIGGRLAEIRRADLRRAFETYQNEPHRMQPVADVGGVYYFNDSKATTTEAVWNALSTFDRPIVWIAGGVDKGLDWGELIDIVRARVKALVVIGKDTRRLEEAMQPIVPVLVRAHSMEQAVEEAARLAKPGDVVLLSPGCASMDWYRDYTERGEAFQAAVHRLKEQHEQKT